MENREAVFAIAENKNHATPRVKHSGRQLSVPHPFLSPPFAPTRSRLAQIEWCLLCKLGNYYQVDCCLILWV